jgi:hypothetical protein
MYGALCAVLGPGLGGDVSLQHSAAWKLITLRAWDALAADRRTRMEYALHDLNDQLQPERPVASIFLSRADTFHKWAAEPEIAAMGEWA